MYRRTCWSILRRGERVEIQTVIKSNEMKWKWIYWFNKNEIVEICIFGIDSFCFVLICSFGKWSDFVQNLVFESLFINDVLRFVWLLLLFMFVLILTLNGLVLLNDLFIWHVNIRMLNFCIRWNLPYCFYYNVSVLFVHTIFIASNFFYSSFKINWKHKKQPFHLIHSVFK